jgi:nitrite reductase/ring-hydroxylating ferredoxin subunit
LSPNNVNTQEVAVGCLEDLEDPGCREFRIGTGDWPFKGFVVRQGDNVFAYQNYCVHAGHPLNWQPDRFLTEDGSQIICASHGAIYNLESGICVAGPGAGKALKRVDVRIQNGTIYVQGPDSVR